MNDSQRPQLLIVTETLALPGLDALGRTAGFECLRARGVRDAIARCRRRAPSAVLAEYHYNPTYSTFTSSLESLLAGLQKYAPAARLLIITEARRRQHLDGITPRFRPHMILQLPLDEAALLTGLRAIASESG